MKQSTYLAFLLLSITVIAQVSGSSSLRFKGDKLEHKEKIITPPSCHAFTLAFAICKKGDVRCILKNSKEIHESCPSLEKHAFQATHKAKKDENEQKAKDSNSKVNTAVQTILPIKHAAAKCSVGKKLSKDLHHLVKELSQNPKLAETVMKKLSSNHHVQLLPPKDSLKIKKLNEKIHKKEIEGKKLLEKAKELTKEAIKTNSAVDIQAARKATKVVQKFLHVIAKLKEKKEKIEDEVSEAGDNSVHSKSANEDDKNTFAHTKKDKENDNQKEISEYKSIAKQLSQIAQESQKIVKQGLCTVEVTNNAKILARLAKIASKKLHFMTKKNAHGKNAKDFDQEEKELIEKTTAKMEKIIKNVANKEKKDSQNNKNKNKKSKQNNLIPFNQQDINAIELRFMIPDGCNAERAGMELKKLLAHVNEKKNATKKKKTNNQQTSTTSKTSTTTNQNNKQQTLGKN